jgi:hypothetical protein
MFLTIKLQLFGSVFCKVFLLILLIYYLYSELLIQYQSLLQYFPVESLVKILNLQDFHYLFH